MKYNIIFALLALTLVRADYDKSYLEKMNIDAMETYKQLQESMAYKAKNIQETAAAAGGAAPQKGMFGMFGSMLKSAFTSTPKSTNPQADLDELAMYYQTMNYADIMSLDFLIKNCKQDGLLVPATDPELCTAYIPQLIKSVEGRIGTLTSQYLYSNNVVKAPPEWPEHALEMLRALEEYRGAGADYSVEKSLIRMMKDKAEGRGADNREPMRIPEASPIEAMKRPTPPPRQRSGFNQNGSGGYNQNGNNGYNQNADGGYSQTGSQGYNQGGPQGYNQGQSSYNGNQPSCSIGQNNNSGSSQYINQADNLNSDNKGNPGLPSNLGQLPFDITKMVPVAFVPAASLKLDLKTAEKGADNTSVALQPPSPVTASQTAATISPQIQTLPPIQLPIIQPGQVQLPQPEVPGQAQILQPQTQVLQSQAQTLQPQETHSQVPHGQVMQPQIMAGRIILRCPDSPIFQSFGEDSRVYREREEHRPHKQRYYDEGEEESASAGNNLKAKSVVEKPPITKSDPRLERLYE